MAILQFKYESLDVKSPLFVETNPSFESGYKIVFYYQPVFYSKLKTFPV